jgi:hypothetical protein
MFTDLISAKAELDGAESDDTLRGHGQQTPFPATRKEAQRFRHWLLTPDYAASSVSPSCWFCVLPSLMV